MLRRFALLIFLPSIALAQESPRLAEPPSPEGVGGQQTLGTLFFERSLNTFNWIGRALIDTSLGSFSLKLDEQYSSNVILIAAPERRPESNQQQLSLLPGWNVSQNVALMGRWNSLVYSDNKVVGLSTASFHSLHGGANYAPLSQLFVSPFAGYRWDNQGAFSDKGPSFDIGAGTFPSIDLDGYRLAGTLRLNKDYIDPRLLENHQARIGLQKRFVGATRDSIEFQFTRSRREFYNLAGAGTTTPADTNIESRVDDILSFSNLLDYEADRNLVASFFIAVSNRALDKDIRYTGSGVPSTTQFGTTIEEFLLNAYFQGSYRSSDARSFVLARFQYEERNETHAAKPLPGAPEALFRVVNDNEKTKDNLTRRSTFTGSLGLPLGKVDRFAFSGTASLLRYDTPHVQNVEDRDEQLVTVGITTWHLLNRYLDAGITLNGSLSHIVYLLGERSANNNINRVIRLAPSVSYRPFRRASTVNTFEVLANYTVYDFEAQAALIRSFSYRQFSWVDSSTVPLAARISLDFFAFLKLYERGQLKWSEFAERTENAFADETYALQMRFEPSQNLTVAAGVRYFEQTRYVYRDAVKAFDGRLKSFGPTCLIRWETSRSGSVLLSGWYEERRQSDGVKRTLPNLTLNIQLRP